MMTKLKHLVQIRSGYLYLVLAGWLAAVWLMQANAHAWGVLAPATTHQHIMREAYRLLQADPAFDPGKFPALPEMMKHEGVNWGEARYTGSGLGIMPDISLLDGPGPDAKGNSPFSWHYYNPKTGEGGGPEAVRRHYRYLAEGMQTGKKEVLPKAAAWGAHFLADMHCPYHINGATMDTAKKIKAQQLDHYKGTKYEGAVYLSDDIKGSVKLSYLTPVKFLSNDFRTEMDRFLAIGEDWFDPWYYNGDAGLHTQTSSHIAWEVTINPGPYDLSGYDDGWRNGKKAYKGAADAQGAQAAELAKAAAAATRAELTKYFDAPQPRVNRAIQAVYTMWRASFSALAPQIEATQKDGFIVAKGKVDNRGSGPMDQAEVQLVSSGCALVSDSPVQQLGSIPARGTVQTREWKLKAEGPACVLRLEAVAASRAPDLQYAAAETTIAAAAKDVKAERPGADTPAGAEGFMINFNAEVTAKYLNLKLPKLDPPNAKINAMTDVFRDARLTWEGVKFSFTGTAHLDTSHRTNFPYMAAFPMPFGSDWWPGDYKMTATGSIDPSGAMLRDVTVHLEWKGKPVAYASECWDMPEKRDSFSYTYTFKDVPLKGKGPFYLNGGKESGLLSYQYELEGDALKGKLAAFSYAQRWCLHPGETYDADKLNAAGPAGRFSFKMGFVKRK